MCAEQNLPTKRIEKVPDHSAPSAQRKSMPWYAVESAPASSAEGLRRTRRRRLQSTKARGEVRRVIHLSGQELGRCEGRCERGGSEPEGDGANLVLGRGGDGRRHRDALSVVWLSRRIRNLSQFAKIPMEEHEPCLGS